MNLIPGFPSPTTLPDSPWFQHHFLEYSGWTAAIIALLGLSLFLILSRAGRRAIGVKLATVLTAIGAIVWVVGRVVETPAEVLGSRTHALVGFIAKANTAAATPMLDDAVVIKGGSFANSTDKQSTLDRVRVLLGTVYPIKEWAILESQAHVDGLSQARTRVLVRSQSDAGLGINFSWWLLTWKRNGAGDWLVTKAEAEAIQGLFNADGSRSLSPEAPQR